MEPMTEGDVHVKVAVRCRPMNETEKTLGSQNIVEFKDKTIVLKDPNPYASTPSYAYTYDFAYGFDCKQEDLYNDMGTFILDKAFEGYNGTIFAYGQTGSGKTHCITGTANDVGIIPRMNRDLFLKMKSLSQQKDYLVTVSYLELYNEIIFDLLNPGKASLKVREHPKLGVYVEDLTELVVFSEEDISRKMAEGNSVRHTAATKMNDRSSRSHSVFTIKVDQKDRKAPTNGEEVSSLQARINLVDLAGSERVAKTEAEGSTLKEATMINKSLSALGNVINALADPKKRKGHIPFRSSKLTRLLQDSLGGNTVTIMIATLSPADRNFDETLNTLQYANRAKNIQNKSKKNESNPAKIVKELQEQIEKLRNELAHGGNDPEQVKVMKSHISDLEYANRQTWAEKQKLTRAFEESRWASLAKNGMLQLRMNLMKKQKQKLEERIDVLMKENTLLRVDNEQKQRDMDALCADVAKMLEAESEKMNRLEQTIASLHLENEKLRHGHGGQGANQPAVTVQADLSGELSKHTMGDYIKYALRDDPLASRLLPENTSARDAVSDGVLFCKLINKAVPGTIDERVLNINPTTANEVIENLNLCINSAKAIGCNIADVSIEDIIGGEEGKILRMLSEIERISQLSSLTVKQNQSLVLLKGDESLTDFVKQSPEQLLIRWVNHHLKNGGQPPESLLSNFSEDIKDSVKYTHLLRQLSPQCDLTPLSESNLEQRAELVLRQAGKINCRKYVSPQDIAKGNAEKNLLFVANLFNQFPTITASGKESSNASVAKTLSGIKQEEFAEMIQNDDNERREERAIRTWINSLDLGVHLKSLAEEIQDGVLILKILDKVSNRRIVNWKKVNLAPVGIYKKIENGNYCVELGRELGFSLVGIAGKDIVDGNMKLSLALISQAMQSYFLNLLKNLRFGGHEVTEELMLKWVNDKVREAGKTSVLKSWRDQAVKDGSFLVDLLHAIKPGSVNYALVTRGMTDEERSANAKYIITVARKLGCHIFVVWEDIMEAKQSRIICLVSELMTVAHSA